MFLGGSGGSNTGERRERIRRRVPRSNVFVVVMILAATVGASLLDAPHASAAPAIVVTTTADVVDPTDGLVSLREAVTLSNTQVGDDTIQLAVAAGYALTLCSTFDGVLRFFDPGTRVTIEGNGSTIDEQCPTANVSTYAALFGVKTALTVKAATVRSTSRGVAVTADGPSPELVLDHAVIVDAANTCIATMGGPVTVRVLFSRIDGCGGRGIDMGGAGGPADQLDLQDSEISGARNEDPSTTSTIGGALVAPSATILRSSIHDNPGGGPVVWGAATIVESHVDRNGGSLPGLFAKALTATDSTFDDNTATGAQRGFTGLLVTDGQVSLTRVSVSRNTGPAAGFGPTGSTAVVTITDSHIDGNRAVAAPGGLGAYAGIWSVKDPATPSTRQVQLTRSTVNDNAGPITAGVHTDGPTSIVDSTVAGNISGSSDPSVTSGAVVGGTTLTMTGSTVSGNTAAPVAEPAATLPSAAVVAGTAVLSNNTITGNSADVGGVLLRTGGSLRHVTLADNTGVLAQDLAAAGPLTFDGTVLSRGVGAAPTCAVVTDPEAPAAVGSFASGGYNVVSDATCPFGAGTGDVVNAGPVGLAPLAANGGTTTTRLPLPPSLLRDRIPTSAAALCSGTDQRGVERPQGAACDVGAVEAQGSRFHAVAPTRILDSRTGATPGFVGPVAAGVPRALTVTGGAVPASAAAVVVNVTATGSTTGSYLNVWPAGTPQPTASSVNFGPGQTIPNLVTAKVGANGQLVFATNTGQTDVVVDLLGWFDDGTGSGDGWSGIDPARLLDSRTATGGWHAKLVAEAPRELAVRGLATIPADATAIVANVTATGADTNSFLTLWPAGGAKPTSSNVNFAAGETIANGVIVPVGANGKVSIANAVGATDVVVDVTGYFTPGGGSRFFAVAPTRVLDDRANVGVSGPWQPNQTRAVTVTGGAIAGNAAGVAANVTVTNATVGSFLSVFPHATTKPSASSINFGPGQTIANQTMVRVSGGQVDIFNQQGKVDVIADVVGSYAPP